VRRARAVATSHLSTARDFKRLENARAFFDRFRPSTETTSRNAFATARAWRK